MTRLTFVSDLHGNLPIYLPPADILIIGGDAEPDNSPMGQADWYNTTFRKWINRIRPNYKEVILHAGNHSMALESYYYRFNEESDKIAEILDSLPLTIKILGEINLYGYSFLFNSYCMRVGRWAFPYDESDYARWCEKYDKCDILVCHGPPRGMLDSAYRWMPDNTLGFECIGSAELASWVMKVRPSYILSQHVHEQFGQMEIEHYCGKKTTIINGCQVTRSLQYIHRPVEIFLPDRN